MNPVSTVFLIVSFIGIAVFGVFAMSHESGHSQGCIAAVARGADCPNNVLPFVAFHFDTFKSFSNAIFGNLPALFLVSFLVVGIATRIRAASPPTPSYRHLRQIFSLLSLAFNRKIVRWFALHENSPTFS